MTNLFVNSLNILILCKSLSFAKFTTHGSFDSLLNVEFTVLQLPWSCYMDIAMNIDHTGLKVSKFLPIYYYT